MKYMSWRRAYLSLMSPPSRGAWIEIVTAQVYRADWVVAPLAGGVD